MAQHLSGKSEKPNKSLVRTVYDRHTVQALELKLMDKPSEFRTAMLKIVGEHALDFTSAIYGDLLQQLLPSVQTGDWHSNTHVLPFTFTCAAALEATLNDHLVAYAFSEYGVGDYRRPAEAFLSMSLRSKLDIVVPLLSHNKFLVRSDSKSYQVLSQLIRLRNELVHSKSFFVECIKWNEEQDELIVDKKQHDKMKERGIRAVKSSNCIEFYQALRSLDECFFYALETGKLFDNELIKEKR